MIATKKKNHGADPNLLTIMTNFPAIFVLSWNFSLLDPYPGGKLNADSYGSGSTGLVIQIPNTCYTVCIWGIFFCYGYLWTCCSGRRGRRRRGSWSWGSSSSCRPGSRRRWCWPPSRPAQTTPTSHPQLFNLKPLIFIIKTKTLSVWSGSGTFSWIKIRNYCSGSSEKWKTR